MTGRRPNVLFILADDMGYGDVGAFGNDAVQTPHLDRLAGEGVCLTQHYSGSCMCAPARAALLTGKYPHRVGAIDVPGCRGLDRIALRERTLADRFRQAGYCTGMAGKWHNGSIDPRYHPCRRGFDEFVGFQAGIMPYWEWVLDWGGAYRRGDGRYLTDVLTQAAVDFVERHRGERFFYYLAYNAPHTPLEAPEEDAAPFIESGRYTTAVSTIYGMNRRMDSGVGQVLDALERCGIAENTIVLFTSDNGPMFFGQGDACTRRENGCFNGSKGSVLEGGIRVPAVARWPAGWERGQVVDGLVHFCDWMPTLLSAAGIEVAGEAEVDGRSALPVLRGESNDAGAPRFWQWNRYTPVADCNAAVRDGPWKLIRPAIPEAMAKPAIDNERTRLLYTHPERVADIWREPLERALSAPREALLYNLDRDPYEQRDLAASEPERVRALQTKLDRWFESVLADFEAIPHEERMQLGTIPEGGWPHKG